MSVKTHIILFFSILLALLIAIIFTMGMMTTRRDRVAQMELHRFETSKLADQLRQSSDDLTRMARTYAVTGDPVFEKYFYEILAIRDGKAPRPENYDRIYWDFVTVNDERPSPFGPPAALIDLMKEIGLTPEELAKLEDAKKDSDDLTRLEAQAFGAMKGLFVDDDGELTVKRVPDPSYALALLHGEAYHNAKMVIMRPIGEFMEMINKRTLDDVRQARAEESMFRSVVMVLVTVLILFSLFAYFHIRRRLINPVVELSRIAKQVEKGHLDARADVSTADEIGILNNAFNQMMERIQSGIENLGREIGQRKQAEEEIHLARVVAEEARGVAEAATRSKDMFLAAMSHEIRTPMNGVVGMIELMQGTPLAADQRRMLETAKDSSFALLTIINDILDFSKIEAGKMEIENVAFDLRKAADAVGEMLGGMMAAEKGLPLVVHIQPEVPEMIIGDQVRIRQILLNLAGNAIKFTEEGEVHVGIRVAKTLKNGSVDVVYEVKDSGIGMTEEQVSRLFKPFEQAEASTTRKYGGTGLGLSIVARLIELMGGKVEVESKPGKGSTFRATVRHNVPEEAGETTAPNLGRIKMLALSAAGSRFDLLSQIIEGEDTSVLRRLAAETTREEFLITLKKAEADDDPFSVVYLSVDVGSGERDQLRNMIKTNKELQSKPQFLVELHNTPVMQDIPSSVLIPATPYTESNLVRALAIALGRASPDIVSRPDVEGEAAELPTIDEAEAAGRLILVAEDHKVNQEVIGRQLAIFGYAHEIAGDGEIALKMLSKRSYALLLSDVHMPKKDGYKLTQAIREREKTSGTRLPIIAVTANALQGEGDRCLEAGMDAYMAKPVRMKELRDCLKKWMPKGAELKAEAPSREEEGAAAASEIGQTGEAVVDLNVLIELLADDETAINSILSKFRFAVWEDVGKIESGHKASDWTAVAEAGHKLNSPSRMIGANQLADICEGLEEAGKAGDEKTIKKLMPKLRAAAGAVEAFILGREKA